MVCIREKIICYESGNSYGRVAIFYVYTGIKLWRKRHIGNAEDVGNINIQAPDL